jgi:hypothetical protein
VVCVNVSFVIVVCKVKKPEKYCSREPEIDEES